MAYFWTTHMQTLPLVINTTPSTRSLIDLLLSVHKMLSGTSSITFVVSLEGHRGENRLIVDVTAMRWNLARFVIWFQVSCLPYSSIVPVGVLRSLGCSI